MVKPGATIIDVGINRITSRDEFDRFFAGNAKREATFAKRGSTIVGDVDPKAFEGGWRVYACSRRRGSADDCHAHGQHCESCQITAGAVASLQAPYSKDSLKSSMASWMVKNDPEPERVIPR